MTKLLVDRVGQQVQLTIDGVDGAKNSWMPSFDRNVCNEFHADLEVEAYRKAIQRFRNEAILGALDRVENALRDLPGKRRILRALDSIRDSYY